MASQTRLTAPGAQAPRSTVAQSPERRSRQRRALRHRGPAVGAHRRDRRSGRGQSRRGRSPDVLPQPDPL